MRSQVSKKEVGVEIEKMLQDQLSAHCCPVCMFTMAPSELSEDQSDHSPLLLFPCGHNLCKLCVEKIKKPSCPYCRAKIEHRAVNRPLLEMITLFCNSGKVADKINERVESASYQPPPLSQQSLQQGDIDAQPTGDTTRTKAFYISKLRHFTARANVLENELSETEVELLGIEDRAKILQDQERASDEECRKFYERWQAAKQRLEEVTAEVKQIDQRRNECLKSKKLLTQTLEPLIRDKKKCEIMLQHFDVDVEKI